MAITDENRHQLYNKLEQVLGKEEARVLMAHLPPVGWTDVATKQDLRQELELVRLDIRAELHRELKDLQREMSAVQRNLFFGFLAAQGALAALIFGVLG